MVDCLIQIGSYLIVLGMVFVGAVALVLWGLFGDRSKGRQRCPKCWCDMQAHRTGGQGLVCPDCGHDARQERQLYKDRRQWWAVILGIVLLYPTGYPLGVACGWCREQPAIQALNRKAVDHHKATGLRTSSVPHSHVHVEPVGPQWLIGRLPPECTQCFDRGVEMTLIGVPVFAEDLARIKKLRHLGKLSLHRCSMTDEDLARIKALSNLKELRVTEMNVTDSGVAELKHALPDLRVYR